MDLGRNFASAFPATTTREPLARSSQTYVHVTRAGSCALKFIGKVHTKFRLHATLNSYPTTEEPLSFLVYFEV